MIAVRLYWRVGCVGGCAVVCGGCDDYSWVVVKVLEFGVGYKRLRWGWLSGCVWWLSGGRIG